MTKRKGIRLLAALALCFTLCFSFTLPAFAYAEDTEQELPVTEATQPEETSEPEPTEAPEPYEGEPFEEEGNVSTRDLLYDKATNKQFITIQTKAGNTFYIVIDYDAPINEEEEQYQTYFLNMVDEDDLLALMDETAAAELTTCTCDTKCEAGAVNTECPVCKNNMSECTGTAPEPEPTEEVLKARVKSMVNWDETNDSKIVDLDRFISVYRSLQEIARKHRLEDGVIGPRKLADWVLSTLVTENPNQSAQITIIPGATSDARGIAEMKENMEDRFPA